MVAKRDIGRNDLYQISRYLTFLEWQFKQGDDKKDEENSEDDVEIIYVAEDESDSDVEYDGYGDEIDKDNEDYYVEVIAVTDQSA